MNKESFMHLVENKLKEVSQVFSQNSTALAREYTLANSSLEIKKALEDLFPETKPEIQEEIKDKPVSKKK